MSNLKKKIDIIMPNYNKGKFIDKAIKSVISQSFKNWRLFIVDDNSSDNSKEIILKYKKDKRIKLFFLKKNKGPSYCRNLAIKKSNSKYIAFLDSDDFWKKEKLISQLNFMIKNKFYFTFTDYIPILDYDNFKKQLKSTKIAPKFMFKNFVNNSSINTSTMILNRKFIKNIKFRNLKLMEDYIFKCELMKKTNIPFMKFPKSTAIYRIIQKSRSSKKFSNLINLWIINKKYNELNLFNNIISLLSISLNSIKKYGFK
jgi:teichuronic acid biosynthesis glycosyltransferase TuaG